MDYIHESKCLSNEGAKRLSEINILTSEYNPYKRGIRVIKLNTPKCFMKSKFKWTTGETIFQTEIE